MGSIIDYLDGLGDGPVFRRDLEGRFGSATIDDWLLSGRTTPYRVVSPFPGSAGDVLVIRLSHPSPNAQWRDLVNSLRGVDLYRAALRFRDSR